jgi:hypothetical protein
MSQSAQFPYFPVPGPQGSSFLMPYVTVRVGFFDAFDIRFCRSRGFIEIEPRP